MCTANYSKNKKGSATYSKSMEGDTNYYKSMEGDANYRSTWWGRPKKYYSKKVSFETYGQKNSHFGNVSFYFLLFVWCKKSKIPIKKSGKKNFWKLFLLFFATHTANYSKKGSATNSKSMEGDANYYKNVERDATYSENVEGEAQKMFHLSYLYSVWPKRIHILGFLWGAKNLIVPIKQSGNYYYFWTIIFGFFILRPTKTRTRKGASPEAAQNPVKTWTFWSADNTRMNPEAAKKTGPEHGLCGRLITRARTRRCDRTRARTRRCDRTRARARRRDRTRPRTRTSYLTKNPAQNPETR